MHFHYHDYLFFQVCTNVIANAKANMILTDKDLKRLLRKLLLVEKKIDIQLPEKNFCSLFFDKNTLIIF